VADQTLKIDVVQEPLLHILVAAPIPLVLAYVAVRGKRPNRRAMLGFSLFLFVAIFFVSYSFFCMTCE
jgi:hypothetical protein